MRSHLRQAFDEDILRQQAMVAELASIIDQAYDIEKRVLRSGVVPMPGAAGSPEWSAEITGIIQEMWAVYDEHARALLCIGEVMGRSADGMGSIMSVEAADEMHRRHTREQRADYDRWTAKFPNAKMGKH